MLRGKKQGGVRFMMSAVALALAAGAALSPATVAQHRALFTLDTHVDVPTLTELGDSDLLRADHLQVDLLKMEGGGLDAAFFILFSPQGEISVEGYRKAREEAQARYGTIRRMLDSHPDRIELARSAEEARRIHDSGKLVAFLGMENGNPLAGNAANLRWYYELGVRYLGLVHIGHNALGDSANPDTSKNEPRHLHGGLTAAGRAVVAEANRFGIMVDVSHAEARTAIDMARASRAPVIASHSAIRALNDIPRNVNDDQMRAVKATGGVVQVVAFTSFLKKNPPQRFPAIIALAQSLGMSRRMNPEDLPPAEREKYIAGRAEIDRKWPEVPATVADLANHIDYAVRLIGIDHVGIASDFGGGGGVEGWRNAAETANVTAELIARGYSADDLRKLWGGNLLRVLADVERVADNRQ
jgi:membrane dipeptidase